MFPLYFRGLGLPGYIAILAILATYARQEVFSYALAQ